MSGLALGTVQFGQAYGVANASGRVPEHAAAAIIDLARDHGIDTLDTAAAYGDSEACLGRLGVSAWRVITKLPPLPGNVTDIPGWSESQVHGSLQRLQVERLDALLVHRSSDLLGPNGARLLDALQRLQRHGGIRSIGISIYDPAELTALWPVWQPEMVQAPCNVLDRRLILSGWLARLNEQGVRVQVRSVFLQGLLLMSAAQRPAWFGPWSALLDRWLAWCEQQRALPLQAALAFARSLAGVERVVVGVDAVTQLQQILQAMHVTVASPPSDLLSEDRNLLEPSRWQLP